MSRSGRGFGLKNFGAGSVGQADADHSVGGIDEEGSTLFIRFDTHAVGRVHDEGASVQSEAALID